MERYKIAIVVGSLRKDSINLKIAKSLCAMAHERLDCDIVPIGDLPLYNQESDSDPPEQYRRFRDAIGAADGILFVTPEYNRGLPAALKNALDFLYAEWNTKAAGIVCYGSSGGLRAAEHLKSVLGELQIATVRAQVSLSIYDDMTELTQMSPRDYQARNLHTMMDQLSSWAGALRPERVSQTPADAG